MVIVHSYVSLPEGSSCICLFLKKITISGNKIMIYSYFCGFFEVLYSGDVIYSVGDFSRAGAEVPQDEDDHG